MFRPEQPGSGHKGPRHPTAQVPPAQPATIGAIEIPPHTLTRSKGLKSPLRDAVFISRFAVPANTATQVSSLDVGELDVVEGGEAFQVLGEDGVEALAGLVGQDEAPGEESVADDRPEAEAHHDRITGSEVRSNLASQFLCFIFLNYSV